ncbi:MAG: hypothetical protein ABFC88_13150 [Thermoguttaceae bacterium]
MSMTEYQNADYRSIYVGQPFDLPRVGECRLVIFVEDMGEYDASQDGTFWTALFLVAPAFAGNDRIQESLEFIGWRGERRPPRPIDKAIALAEAGYRLVLWERETDNPDADLDAAKWQATRYYHLTNELLPFLPAVTFGETGYRHLAGKSAVVA